MLVAGLIRDILGLGVIIRSVDLATFLYRTALLLFETPNGATLVRVRILNNAVYLTALVSFWQVFCNRKTFRIAEE